MKNFMLLLFSIMLTVPALAKTIDKNIRKTFDVGEGASLYLKHGDGEVEVTSWDKDVVDISIVYHAVFTGIQTLRPNDFEVEFERRRDQISVIGREPSVIGIGSRRVREYKYTVKAPPYVVLELEGVDGDVSIVDRANDVTVSTVDGDVQLYNVTAENVRVHSIDGDLELEGISAVINCRTIDGKIQLADLDNVECHVKTIDGDISIEKGGGDFTLRAVDGDIDASYLSPGRLEINTSDGKIDLDLLNVDDMQAKIKTGDGNVRIRLQEGASVTLVIKTGDGRIRTDLSPVADLQTDDDYFSGAINGGSGLLEVRTGDGNVEIIEQ